MTPEVVGNSGIVGAALPPVETSPVVYKMVVPNSEGGTSSSRIASASASTRACGTTNTTLPGRSGPAPFTAWRSTTSTTRCSRRNYWRPNEAQNWKEFRSEGWRKAWTGETHYGISIIQADDQWDLEHASYWIHPGVDSSLSGDLYPGNS